MKNSNKSSIHLTVFNVDGGPSVSVSASALENIKNLARLSSDAETGGILVGRNIGRNIEVTNASDPGPNAKQTATHFARDTAYCREFLAHCYQENGGDYVGEWHSHIVGLRTLSMGDINTLTRILIDPDYDFVSFAILLVVVRESEMELLVYVAERGGNEARSYIKIIEAYRGTFP